MQLAYLLCLLSTLCLLHSLVLGGGLHGALVDCGNLSTQPVTTEELITGSEKYWPPPPFLQLSGRGSGTEREQLALQQGRVSTTSGD